MVYVHHVVVLFEFLDQLLDRFAAFGVKLLHVGGDTHRLARDDLEALVVEPLLDGAERFVGGVNRDAVLLGVELVDPQVDHLQLQLLGIDTLGSAELEDALMVEQEAHRAAVAQRAAAFVKIHAHVGHGAVGVVGGRFDEERNAVRAVSLVDHLLVVGGILLGGPLDGPFDVLLGHVLGLGVLNQNAQAGVARRVGTSGLDGDLDLFAQLGEGAGHVTPAFHFSRFAILKGSSHKIIVFFGFFRSWCKGIKFGVKN